MKKIPVLIICLSVLGCANHEDCDNQIRGLRIYSDSLQLEIMQHNIHIEKLKEAIELREGEISILGHELDSFKYKLKK